MTAHVPFPLASQLNRDTLPSLATRHRISNTGDEWDDCLEKDLRTHVLDAIYPYLWLAARKDSSHIDALHKHIVYQRTIIIAEEPRLHLVRYYGVVYIKPIPDYLLNWSTWETYISEVNQQPVQDRQAVQYDKYRAAVGFLRSYSFLIRHESDFIIAQEANLLPKYIKFQRFQVFIQHFHRIGDDHVSHRYQYGQFRLTRLNWVVRAYSLTTLFKPASSNWRFTWNYEIVFWQSSQYLQHVAAPFIVLFIFISLILSAMQVALAAEAAAVWDSLPRLSWGVSIFTMIIAALPLIAMVSIILGIILVQGQFAVLKKWGEGSSRGSTANSSRNNHDEC